MEDEEEEEEGEEEEEEEEEDPVEEVYFDVTRFIDSENDTVDYTGAENDDNGVTAGEGAGELSYAGSKSAQEDEDPEEMDKKIKQLEEIFSCLPPVLIRRILRRDDVNGDIGKASQRLQEFQDMENPLDIFKTPVTAKPPAEIPKVNRAGNPPEEQTCIGEEKNPRGAESKNFRKKKRRSFGNENEMHKEQGDVKELPELMRAGNNKAEQREGNQGYRGQNARRRGGNRGRPRGGSRGVPRGGFVQGQGDNPEFSDWVMGVFQGWGDGPGDAFHPQRGYGSREWGGGPGDAFQPQRGHGSRGGRGLGDGPGDAFQPQRGHGSRGGRGNQPKPKPKPNNRGRGYRGRDQHFQQPEGFQGSQQFSYDDRESQFTQRQRYPERGGNQARGKNVAPVLLSDLARGNAHRVCDDSDSGSHLRGLEPSRRGQGNRGRPRDSGNRGRGQTRMTRVQSSSSVEGARGDQRADTGENVGKQSRFERNKLLVCELSESTTNDGVVNFIEAMSGGEEVKEVLMLRNGSALVTMVNDITSKLF